MAGHYTRTELTTARLQRTTTKSRITKLVAQIKEESERLANLNTYITELEQKESK